jgi:protein arginine kinase activator
LKVQRRIEELKAALSKAIAKEEYEKAAEIRDQIKKLEKEQQMR